MGEVVQIQQVQNKTEQRVEQILSLLKNATAPMTYDDLRLASGAVPREGKPLLGGIAYDMLLYVITTLISLGLVERDEVVEGKGHPRYYFYWKANTKAARVSRTRLQRPA